jgi:hypothetical protein
VRLPHEEQLLGAGSSHAPLSMASMIHRPLNDCRPWFCGGFALPPVPLASFGSSDPCTSFDAIAGTGRCGSIRAP